MLCFKDKEAYFQESQREIESPLLKDTHTKLHTLWDPGQKG